MTWKDILKVDNIEFKPDEFYSAYYDPSSGEITLNLSQIPGETEEEIVADLTQIITHEASHKAVDSILDEKVSDYMDELGPLIIKYLEGGRETDLQNILNTLTQALALIGLDEAYAYSTGAFSKKKPQINVAESVANTIMQSMETTFENLVKSIEMMLSLRPDLRRHAKGSEESLNKLYRILYNHVFSSALYMEQPVTEFVSRLNEMNNQDKYEFTSRTAKKVMNVGLPTQLRDVLLEEIKSSRKENMRR